MYPTWLYSFTERLLKCFAGDIIVIAGTQAANGCAAFGSHIVDDWAASKLPHFGFVLRVPLPSFVARDDALFVFERRLETSEGKSEERPEECQRRTQRKG